jgi:hypothetical protein
MKANCAGLCMLNQLPAMSITWCRNLLPLCLFTLLAASGMYLCCSVDHLLLRLPSDSVFNWCILARRSYLYVCGGWRILLEGIS